MPSEDTKILEFNQYQKSDKAPFIVYADFECLIEKINGCKSNPENSSKTKVEVIWMYFIAFSVPLISSFKSINEHNVDRGKDCMKTFSESLGEHWMKMIYFKKKK